jgi:hypothetical protein
VSTRPLRPPSFSYGPVLSCSRSCDPAGGRADDQCRISVEQDVHLVQNVLGFCEFPLVPGHELIGKVTAVGSKVTKFKAGDLIGEFRLSQEAKNVDEVDPHFC